MFHIYNMIEIEYYNTCGACALIWVNIQLYGTHILLYRNRCSSVEKQWEENSCIVKEGGSRETIGSRPSSNATAHTVGNSSVTRKIIHCYIWWSTWIRILVRHLKKKISKSNLKIPAEKCFISLYTQKTYFYCINHK